MFIYETDRAAYNEIWYSVPRFFTVLALDLIWTFNPSRSVPYAKSQDTNQRYRKLKTHHYNLAYFCISVIIMSRLHCHKLCHI